MIRHGNIRIAALAVLTVLLLFSCDPGGGGYYYIRNSLGEDVVLTVVSEEDETRFLISPGQTMRVHTMIILGGIMVPPDQSDLIAVRLNGSGGRPLLDMEPLTAEGWELFREDHFMLSSFGYYVLDINEESLEYLNGLTEEIRRKSEED
jgi:hypothetical protein